MNKENSQHNAPPQWALAFFRWFCDPDWAEDIEGDLRERYNRDLSESGVRRARWLFVCEVAGLVRLSLVRKPFRAEHLNISNMKAVDWILMAALHALLVLVMVLPFLPGPPNKLVVGLSALAQSAGFLGVVLGPIGILWLYLDARRRGGKTQNGRYAFVLGVIVLVLAALPCLLALTQTYEWLGVGPGLITTGAGACLFYKAFQKIRQFRFAPAGAFNLTPVYLLTIPTLAWIMRMYVLAPVSAYSRELAMDAGETLVARVELYKSENGHYPHSLRALASQHGNTVAESPVMGISELKYSASDDGFSVSFSQWQNMAIDEEIVLFQKGENQSVLASGDDWRQDRYRIKGAYASFKTRRNDWRYYWCD